MAGRSPEHHVDRMGYCLGDCSVAAILAFEILGVTKPRECSVIAETEPAIRPTRPNSVVFDPYRKCSWSSIGASFIWRNIPQRDQLF